ncbi:amidase domain-containing protein [Lutispora saccharofermentans]|uniref:Amidase domain-containing protein n=1 Tax=Lutispora saccharofermentans TaxID=3024236 RepID=A0ABT1NK35_9FIRM|nr:amidase domain-containing protein [Lutispora saccharofermentans]MCQ1531547.1 amidase domain-containing protein [Lutispora saccharofermentans]
MNRRFKKWKITAFFILIFSSVALKAAWCDTADLDEKQIAGIIQSVYDERCKAMISGDWKALRECYDTSRKYALWSFEHEAKRIKYLHDWSEARGIKLIDIKSSVYLGKITKKDGMYSVFLTETYKFEYIYKDDINQTVNTFGTGVRHNVGLVNKDDKWLLSKDWYTDFLQEALYSYSGMYVGAGSELTAPASKVKSQNSKYDREKAAQYADKYCGIAWGSGNDFKYNSKYQDYNGIGGDCTNYVSQCIGDKEEGGGIPFDGTWFATYPKYGKAQGSAAFVNANAFWNYILYSGKGRLIKKGTYKELTKPIEDYPIGIVGKIEVGDLLCYEKDGKIDHFSIITAKDSKGYPMINSHTSDRYHVPFDFGWSEKFTKFHLIHIGY